MARRMLIDATHAEETRVAVVDGNRLIEFDYESQLRKQLKGNIYLAKVTRVEPSLQAAFVNFGGNRHGFLPFSEIHPDYFRIPIADRQAILAEQEAEMEARQAEEQAREEEEEREEEEDSNGDDEAGDEDANGDTESDEDEDESGNKGGNGRRKRGGGRKGRGRGGRGRRQNADSRKVEVVGGDDVEGDRPMRPNTRRNYKIQEVIKRGQIMLIQVSKEERGNKGAAVTSYLSLPGRYCVLMPNSPRAGGVSRKVASVKDRKRLREILKELNVPQGMSVIMRTAGVSRTKAEIKRDLDYLMRLWDNIRELTLQSTAPALVYEEGSLIKRSIRDIYTKDIEEILVAGDHGYKETRDFMKMLVPSHVRKIQQYKDEKIPLFHRYQVENQIAEIGDASVTLKSGGYLVINPTEALVSIDVNSGKATKERHIEETALKTNMEAAEEVARQLRLRDLGGLVVIDFIDMEDNRNNIKVERKLKETLSKDRARIQVGRISNFGLLELSRQRLNPSLTEAQFRTCTHCNGVGNVRTIDSTAIMALRTIEEEGIRERSAQVILRIANDVALYILNNKRAMLNEIEQRYGFQVQIQVDDELKPSGYEIEPVKGPVDQEGDNAQALDGSEVELKEPEPNEGQDESTSRGRGRSGPRQNDDRDKDDQGKDGKGGARKRGRRGGRRRNQKPDDTAREGEESPLSDTQAGEDGISDNQQAQSDTRPETGPEETEADTKAEEKKGSRKASTKKATKEPDEVESKTAGEDEDETSGKSGAKSGAKATGKSDGKKSGSSKSGGKEKPATAKSTKKEDEDAAKSGSGSGSEKADEDEPAKETKAKTDKGKSGSGKAKSPGRKKAAHKDDAAGSDDDAPSEPSTPEASNDTQAEPEKDYEVVNEAPKRKKKGWWNRLME